MSITHRIDLKLAYISYHEFIYIVPILTLKGIMLIGY